MDSGRLPSFLFSLCLHLAVAALALWWPVSKEEYPEPTHGTLVSGLVTLGRAGQAVPGSRQEIPESRKGDGAAGSQAVEPETPPEPPAPPVPEPEAKPVEKAPEAAPPPEEVRKTPEPEATPIPQEPEKKPEEKRPEPKPEPEPEKKPPEEKKPEPRPEEKKPEPKPAEKKPEPKKDALSSALADLGKQVGGDSRGRRGQASPGRGSGKELSSALADLGKQVGGAGDDAAGRGPGGRGGDGMGVQGAYLDVIHSRVKSNWSWPGRADRRKYSTLVNIQIAADGRITGARILRSSGDAPYDSSVMRALNLTRMLEPPPNPELMNVDIEFAF